MQFLGVLLSLLFCLAAGGLGALCYSRFTEDEDPATKFGVFGLLGLGTLGLITLLVGILPQGLQWGQFVVFALAAVGLFAVYQKKTLLFKFPTGMEGGALFVICLCAFFSFIALLAPSTSNDWDSIAYHMAVPKQYLLAGQIFKIPYIHHSNFPSSVDLLYVWGLKLAGQSGAKAIDWAFGTFGAVAVFGLTRSRYGSTAAWWSTIAYSTIPIVIWENGTAYVDVAHGLFAGLGAFTLFRAIEGEQRLSRYVLPGMLLGFACGTKYTGIETVGLGLIVFFGLAFKAKVKPWKPAFVIVGVTALVSISWYAKNIVYEGNPVYPFLYKSLGGKDWDAKRTSIYTDEQLSFGVGVDAQHKQWQELGASVFGLSYQPGRYVNPGQKQGFGSPLGAVGIVFWAGLLYWTVVKRGNATESGTVAFTGLSLLLWFVLSQQSRYITSLAIPAVILAGGAVVSTGVGRFVAAIISLQAAFTLWLDHEITVSDALPVALGKVSQDDYLNTHLPFAGAAAAINSLNAGKVALYDQVFGFYLDVPYAWANPPHSTMIPYDAMKDGDTYVNCMESLGFTHAYVQFVDKDTDGAFESAMGMSATPQPLPPDLEAKWRADWIQQWKLYFIDGVKKGRIQPIQGFKGGLLFAYK